MPKNAPCISISPAGSLARSARQRPARLPSSALPAPVPSRLPECSRPYAKPSAKKAQGELGAPTRPCPAVPSTAQNLEYGYECHLDGGSHALGPRPRLWVPLGGSCALPHPLVIAFDAVPPHHLGSGALPGHLGRVNFTSSRGRDCSKTPGSARAKKWEGARRSAGRSRLANSPSPAQTPSIPAATFSLPSRFPLGCGERAPGVHWANGRLRVAVRA